MLATANAILKRTSTNSSLNCLWFTNYADTVAFFRSTQASSLKHQPSLARIENGAVPVILTPPPKDLISHPACNLCFSNVRTRYHHTTLPVLSLLRTCPDNLIKRILRIVSNHIVMTQNVGGRLCVTTLLLRFVFNAITDQQQVRLKMLAGHLLERLRTATKLVEIFLESTKRQPLKL